jgi:hypothetical protein
VEVQVAVVPVKEQVPEVQWAAAVRVEGEGWNRRRESVVYS